MTNTIQPLLMKLSRRDSQRSRLMNRSSSFIAANSSSDLPNKGEIRSSFMNAFDTGISEDGGVAVGRRVSFIQGSSNNVVINSPPALKLLNKSKLSYKELMEG